MGSQMGELTKSTSSLISHQSEELNDLSNQGDSQLRRCVGLSQHRSTRLLQDLRLRQPSTLCRKVSVSNLDLAAVVYSATFNKFETVYSNRFEEHHGTLYHQLLALSQK